MIFFYALSLSPSASIRETFPCTFWSTFRATFQLCGWLWFSREFSLHCVALKAVRGSKFSGSRRTCRRNNNTSRCYAAPRKMVGKSENISAKSDANWALASGSLLEIFNFPRLALPLPAIFPCLAAAGKTNWNWFSVPTGFSAPGGRVFRAEVNVCAFNYFPAAEVLFFTIITRAFFRRWTLSHTDLHSQIHTQITQTLLWVIFKLFFFFLWKNERFG